MMLPAYILNTIPLLLPCSCFRDGINFGPALKPKGWQTPGLLAGAFQGKVSFGDAAIVFTDYLMNGDGSGVTSPPATIVLFRYVGHARDSASHAPWLLFIVIVDSRKHALLC